MPALCLCFEVHEPYRLRHYTVFDMGQNSIYEDDDRNCDIMLHIANNCYLPTNNLFLKMIRRYGKDFRLTYCISGTALDQFEQYAPEVLESFQELAATGNVEFCAETSPHSLAFLYSREEFIRQTEDNVKRIKKLFGKKPVTYRNAELVYNNDMAACLNELGFKSVLTEGAEHVLGWRSPNYVYTPLNIPEMRLFLRNISLSRDMGRHFYDQHWDQWPLTAEKYGAWIHDLHDAQVINIFNDYHVFGLRNPVQSGIFDFMEALPEVILSKPDFHFATIHEAAKKYQPVGEVDVPEFLSWDINGGDLSAWLGNDMQKDAIHTIYSLTSRVRELNIPQLSKDFERLQTADHFHNMSTKWFSSFVPDRPNPFQSPYDAYITYMNVIGDMELRIASAEAQAAVAPTRSRTEKSLPELAAEAAEAPKTTKKRATTPRSKAAKKAEK